MGQRRTTVIKIVTTPGVTVESDDGYATTAPVGKYPANTYGLHEMSGNVYEWVADWYDEEFYGTQKPGKRTRRTASRALASGWCAAGRGTTTPPACASRPRQAGPADRFVGVGFRCVAPLSQ